MNSFPSATLLKKPFLAMQNVSERFLLHRSLIVSMAGLQITWLGLIVWTGTSTNFRMIAYLTGYSVLVTLGVICLPKGLLLKLREFSVWSVAREKRFLFLLCLFVMVAGTFYAFNQRIWGDEEKSFRVAEIISTDGIPAAYAESGWLSKKHPPLVPILYAFALRILGTNLVHMRLVALLFLAGILVVTYFLGRELYGREIGYLASIFLLSFPLVMRLGASAMLDIQLAFLFSLALLLSRRLIRKASYGLACLLGLVIGLGLLTKYNMVFILPVLFFYIVIIPEFRKHISYFAVTAFVSISVLAGWLFYANSTGILTDQIQKILDYSGIYYFIRDAGETVQPVQADAQPTNSDQDLNLAESGILLLGLETLSTRLPSALGVHHFPLILFGGLLLLRRRSPADLFVLLWIGVVSASLLITLPDHRYFLPIFPAIALLIARMFHRFPASTERAVLLSLLLWGGNLYLFLDWVRESHLFLLNP